MFRPHDEDGAAKQVGLIINGPAQLISRQQETLHQKYHNSVIRDPIKLVFDLLERARRSLSHGSNPTIRIYQSCAQQAKGHIDLQLGPGPCTDYIPLRDAQIRVSHSPLCSPPYK